MFTLYLACLIFGGALLIFTLFFGSDGDTDVDSDAEFDLDTEVDPSIETEMDTEADITPDGEGLSAALKYFSLRNFVFFTAFFGLTGVILSWQNIPGGITFITSLMMGLMTAIAGYKVLNYFKKNDVTSTTDLRQLEGLSVKVVVDLSRTHSGKIMVMTPGQNIQLVAKIASEASKDEFNYGEEALITQVKNGIAYIAEKDFLKLT
jgi:hypothetical protein